MQRFERSELRPGIGPVSKDLFQARKLLQRFSIRPAAQSRSLDVGRDYLEREEAALRVDEGIAVNAGKFLARVIAGPMETLFFARFRDLPCR